MSLQDRGRAADVLQVGPDANTAWAPASAGPVTDRCPHCAGAVRPGAPWCTQCWTDLRPAPEPVAEPDPPVPDGGLGVVPGGGQGAVPGGGQGGAQAKGWPCSSCGAANPVELDACAACGTGFLAGLRKQEPPLLVLPGVGDLTLLSRAQRLGLASAVVAVVAVLTAVLSLVFG